MSRFLDNAAKIFEAAECATATSDRPSEITILIGADGGIHMVADSDWPLDSLQAHHGAQMAYRVSQQEQTVRVQGRAGSQTCLFETAKPDRVARCLLSAIPQYRLAPAQLVFSPCAG
ncbi:MAG: hypothetical protein ABI165_16300 [Bryobacteraceae bacterium]